MLNPDTKIFVAGHRGMVGRAIIRSLNKEGCKNTVLRTREELDLLDQRAVHQFFEKERPQAVFLAAAKVGGIHANRTYQADFLYENLTIASNIIHAAAVCDTQKLLFLGSSCIYPKEAPQPIKEESLLTSKLESTNEGYAIAKIAGLKLCEMYQRQYGKRFVSAMPCNLYGSFDNFHPENSHVIPALLHRFHRAKIENRSSVTCWGTGKPMREFLYVDDLADALITLMKDYEKPETINVGSGIDCTIKELTETISSVVGYTGTIEWDSAMPDGTRRKLLDVSKIRALGWNPEHNLKQGLIESYNWAKANSPAFK
jgi:GDP-L-fucose synthase